MAEMIDRRALASGVLEDVRKEVAELVRSRLAPGLAIILVGANQASQIYVDRKLAATRQVGRRNALWAPRTC